jgi:hypothetical protein
MYIIDATIFFIERQPVKRGAEHGCEVLQQGEGQTSKRTANLQTIQVTNTLKHLGVELHAGMSRKDTGTATGCLFCGHGVRRAVCPHKELRTVS